MMDIVPIILLPELKPSPSITNSINNFNSFQLYKLKTVKQTISQLVIINRYFITSKKGEGNTKPTPKPTRLRVGFGELYLDVLLILKKQL